MARVYMVSEDVGPSFGQEFNVTGNGYDCLGESVDDHKDCVVSMGVRESSDHINGDMSPWSFWDCVQV